MTEEGRGEMALFVRYLKDRRKIIGASMLFLAIFAVIFALYGLPLAAVFYPALLCAFAGAAFLALDYQKARKRHRALTHLALQPAAVMCGFPTPKDMDGEDYEAVIQALRAEVSALETAAGAKYRDMVEYYTLWAHQIKTPIAAMRLQLQNEDTALSRRLLSDLFRIEQYVGMVLTFMRLDSASSDYVFKEHSLDDIIRQAVRKFSREFIDRKIALVYEPVGISAVTDDKWLMFVLEQLISNALKYTREGWIRIYVEEPNVLCIRDTGIGIEPEDLPRIFENGYSGYNGRMDKQASGIGLYLCKRICDNLGIGIAVSSEVGEGTIISLNLRQYELKKE